MVSQKVFSTLVLGCVAVTSWAIFLGAGPTMAQSDSANYVFLVGAGFVCDSRDSSSCPAVVKSANGDSYELSGAGTFSRKSITASGTFTRKSASGITLGTGVWLASALVSFKSYGTAPGALPQVNRAMTPMMRRRTMLGPTPTGGLAVFRIRLIPLTGAPQEAVLQVNSALGDVPRERSVEGIRLSLEASSTEFSEEAGGRVMFLSMRPEVNAPVKTPQQEPASDAAEPPSN
jgi:hypothetical protein